MQYHFQSKNKILETDAYKYNTHFLGPKLRIYFCKPDYSMQQLHLFKLCNFEDWVNEEVSKVDKILETKQHTNFTLTSEGIISYPLYLILEAGSIQGPLLLDGLLGAEMMNLLKIRNFSKSSFGVNVKGHISHQKKFCKAMFIHFRFIVSQSL